MFRRTPERMDLKWALVVGWGGLRGALSMVLALSVPADFPHRRELVAMTYGVVLASLVLQGLTIRPILRRLGLVEADA
jgi:CPA1 family monovalent cation:H+ antiporter